MEASHNRNACSTCPGRLVCHCLQVTEEMLVSALSAFDLQSVNEVRDKIGAGDGCTACHKRLRRYIEDRRTELTMVQASSPSPI